MLQRIAVPSEANEMDMRVKLAPILLAACLCACGTEDPANTDATGGLPYHAFDVRQTAVTPYGDHISIVDQPTIQSCELVNGLGFGLEDLGQQILIKVASYMDPQQGCEPTIRQFRADCETLEEGCAVYRSWNGRGEEVRVWGDGGALTVTPIADTACMLGISVLFGSETFHYNLPIRTTDGFSCMAH